MESKVKVTDSLLEDVYELIPLLRREDVREIKALGHTAEQSLLNGFIYSNRCYTVRVDNEIAGMFGISNYNQPKGFASIWFLGSDKMKTIPREWLILGKKYIKEFLTTYDLIGGWIDSRQKLHIRWLQAMGFSFAASQYVNRQRFIQFFKVKEK